MNFFKKHKKLSIFLAVVVFIIFYEVIPELRGDKVYILTRLFFSHPELADKIKIKAYVLTDEQVGELFLHPDKEPILLQNKEFNVWKKGFNGPPPPHLNLVVRIQNRGGWTEGTIQYEINDEVIGKFDVIGLSIAGGKTSDYQNFVIPLGGVGISLRKDPNGYPEITYKWRTLYSSW
jgi:hypothetical protein